MLAEIGPDGHDLVQPLFNPIRWNLTIDSILAGLSPAPVFVDDPHKPRLALTWTQSRVFLAGKSAEEASLAAFRSTIYDRFYPEAAASGLGAFTLHYTPGWDMVIERILAEKHLMRDTRHHYELDARGMDLQPHLPTGYELRAVDERLLAQTDLGHLDGVIEEMKSERPSVEEFLAKSFGFCAIHDETIVAWCMSEYNWGDRCEIGIYTDEAHRQRGVATALATAVIGLALDQGIMRIGWHCWENNEASIATALKLDFALSARYPVYFAYIDSLQNLAVNGYLSLRNGDAPGAVAWFERVQMVGDLPQWAGHYLEQAIMECGR